MRDYVTGKASRDEVKSIVDNGISELEQKLQNNKKQENDKEMDKMKAKKELLEVVPGYMTDFDRKSGI